MTTPTAVRRTAVRSMTVVALAAGLFALGVTSAQAAGTLAPLGPVPAPALLGNPADVLGYLLASPTGTIGSVLPNGILGG
ncbi:hypothetical protein [Streptomyces rhizosphaerihabitans]|uniref:hypothetical protein n=1 Tax=Streptomyces rhizosphaerihabitans TaxID=1266770 RepID=UPI0021C15CC9|nr:hypothetical protein [Streptomyces rhizosphaerihabitans]MCT9005428.1 hypothetical protein [Streptomyces rhizosphaerihabitans]